VWETPRLPIIAEVLFIGQYRIRTCDLWLRRPTLYPAELIALPHQHSQSARTCQLLILLDTKKTMAIILENCMDLKKKNFPVLFGFLCLGMVIGSLGWEIIERLLASMGSSLSFTMKEPVGFNLYVIAVYVRANLGTILGAISGILLFKVL
jgi:hypothetical protein